MSLCFTAHLTFASALAAAALTTSVPTSKPQAEDQPSTPTATSHVALTFRIGRARDGSTRRRMSRWGPLVGRSANIKISSNLDDSTPSPSMYTTSIRIYMHPVADAPDRLHDGVSMAFNI
ncbi:hypothetical protein FRC01_004315, partial [Tulasnella sp. 417]